MLCSIVYVSSSDSREKLKICLKEPFRHAGVVSLGIGDQPYPAPLKVALAHGARWAAPQCRLVLALSASSIVTGLATDTAAALLLQVLDGARLSIRQERDLRIAAPLILDVVLDTSRWHFMKELCVDLLTTIRSAYAFRSNSLAPPPPPPPPAQAQPAEKRYCFPGRCVIRGKRSYVKVH